MKATDRRIRALEDAVAQAARQQQENAQRGQAALDQLFHRIKETSERLVDAPTRADSSPAACISWLMHRTGEQGALAGLEALNAIAALAEQPEYRQEDLFNAIRMVAEERGLAWCGLG